MATLTKSDLDHFHPADLKALYYTTLAAREAIAADIKEADSKTRLYQRLRREWAKKDRLMKALQLRIDSPNPKRHDSKKLARGFALSRNKALAGSGKESRRQAERPAQLAPETRHLSKSNR